MGVVRRLRNFLKDFMVGILKDDLLSSQKFTG
jgi:hypothetical protein